MAVWREAKKSIDLCSMKSLYKTIRRYLPTTFIRNTNADIYLEVFFVFAVATILVTRLFLYLAGYPQISGAGLHIAHLLPGGVLMLAALVILMSYLDHQARWVSAILGGVGFGLFIDELGKFITSDNDYFFRPAIALIYAVFVLLFLGFRRLSDDKSLTRETYVINAIELSKDIFVRDFDEIEKARALQYLQAGDRHDPVIKALSQAIQAVPAKPAAEQTTIRRIGRAITAWYDRAVRHGWFLRVAVIYFALNAVIGIVQALANLYWQTGGESHFSAWAALVSAVFASLFILAGIVRIWRNRQAAYQHFRTGLLVLILLAQFFVFIDDQVSAITGLLLYLLGLLAIDAMIKHESSQAQRPTD